MDLAHYLSHYPEVNIADRSENERILDFFSRKHMQTDKFEIGYDRSPDFFKFLELASDEFYVLSASNDKKALTGVATLSFRDGFIDGTLERVGYLGDLRLKFDRKLLRVWRKIYADLVSPEFNFFNARYLLTAVLDENKEALRALVEAQNADYVYEPIAKYNIVQVFMQGPRPKKKRALQARSASNEDWAAIKEFLMTEHMEKQFGFLFDEGMTQDRFSKWRLKVEDFVVVERDGEIQGVTAIWSPDFAKRIFMASLPRTLDRGIALINKMTPRWALPREGEVLKIKYLTHLAISSKILNTEKRSEVFHALFSFAYDKYRKKCHSLSFADFENFAGGMRMALKYELPATLYSVRHERTPALGYCGSRNGFEMALV